jgi:2-oxoisovalerate dehydrogenase E1 component alpha subunit
VNVVAHFDVSYYQFLDEESRPVTELPVFAQDAAHLLRLYYFMLLNRLFDAKAITLQRTGKLGTYPSTRGQEAVFVGIGDALAKEDILVPYYRDVGALIQRGVKLDEILMYWGGDERGNHYACGGPDFPYSVPIATQTLHAAGVATALRIRNENKAVLVTLGDGATSQGDFYEAMNVAGVWKLPLVFVVSNNQWAISVPRLAQTATATLAQKAIAAGFCGEQVDGNDVVAVRERVFHALKKAREQHEPTLIEAICYRQSDHTTADDASRYEPKGVRDTEWKKEPLARLKKYLLEQQILSPEKDAELQKKCAEEIEAAINRYIHLPAMRPESMFDHLYELLPDVYTEQYNQLKTLGETSHG